MRNTHFILYFFCLSICCELSYAQITRTQVIANADPYTSFTWTASSCNLWNGTSCGGKNVYKATWVTAGTKTSMPYMWGGWSTISQHISAMTNCKSAGDVCSASGGGCSGGGSGTSQQCASGHDCSGLVSRAWALSTKYATSTLPNVSTSMNLSQTQAGDIVNLAGSHTRLIETNYGNGNYRVIEASARDWKTSYFTYTAVQLSSYTPRYYNNISGSTSQPPSCNNDYSCGPPAPMELTINSSCQNTSCSTIGATAPSPDVPFYGGNSCATQYQSGRYDDDVWFTITPANTNPITVTVDPTSGNLDPVIGIYSGACASPTQISCADDNDNNESETVTFTPQAGIVYRIRVFGYDMGSDAGNFDICVTQQGGCSSFTVSLSANPSSIQQGQSSDLSVSKSGGNSPYTYQWSGGLSGSSPSVSPQNTTTYSVTVTDDDGCTATDNVTVNVTAPCNPPLATPSANVNGCSLSTANVSGVSYQWYVSDNPVGGNSRFHTADQTGYYYVVITDGQGCTAQSADVFVDCGTGTSVVDVENLVNLNLFPNPNHGTFKLIANVNSSKPVQIRIFTALGQLVYNRQAIPFANKIEEEISVSHLAIGFYILQMEVANKPYCKKIIIE